MSQYDFFQTCFLLQFQEYQNRFPTNPLWPNIDGAEEYDREESKDGKQVKFTRRVMFKLPLPGWLCMVICVLEYSTKKKLTGASNLVFIEKSELDYQKKVLKMYTVNESLSSKALMTEYAKYVVHKDNPKWFFSEINEIINFVKGRIKN